MKRKIPKRAADYLLVDISNSYTKFAFSSEARIERPARLPTKQLTAGGLRRVLEKRRVSLVVVSSVVPRMNPVVLRAASGTRVMFLNHRLNLGVGVRYPKPHSIGADRLANAAAVAQLYGYPAIVVDFGTAVTFDVVSAKGDYVGGVIAPGLEAMTNFLYQRTALLPKLNLREPVRAVGKTTRAAMMSGAIFGYRGLVHEIIVRIRAEAFGGRVPKIVATGGYARLIGNRLPEIAAIAPNLTLEGVRIIANLNSRSESKRIQQRVRRSANRR